MNFYHIPENEQPLNSLYAVISSDEKGEGVVSMMTPQGAMPLVFGHERNLEIVKPFVKQMAKETGKRLLIDRDWETTSSPFSSEDMTA